MLVVLAKQAAALGWVRRLPTGPDIKSFVDSICSGAVIPEKIFLLLEAFFSSQGGDTLRPASAQHISCI